MERIEKNSKLRMLIYRLLLRKMLMGLGKYPVGIIEPQTRRSIMF